MPKISALPPDTAPSLDDILVSVDLSTNTTKKPTLQKILDLFFDNQPDPEQWSDLTPTVSTVTNNGNRSYDLGFTSTLASLLSPGMRVEITKSVAGNGYMGGLLNGSSHYFTKTTPSGTLGTITNNFTLEAVYEPTTYALGMIEGRGDATANNGIWLRMENTGQVSFGVFNGGGSNYRFFTTVQSLPLNKKTHITASWTSGTVVIYFDGVTVALLPVLTAGTAPTTAGTGGDWSVGRMGAYASQYAAGYVSNCAVFDAVLSSATVKQHGTFQLLGSETSCIGAWSLDNTANDQSSAGNNLTATGGVGYSVKSPHGTLSSGVDTLKAIGLVTAIATSTATIQVPEGCTIPTSGGIASVAYSIGACPFGFTRDKGRWEVVLLVKANIYQAAVTSGTTYNPGGIYMIKPAGKFEYSHNVTCNLTGSTDASKTTEHQISTSNTSFSTGSEQRSGASTYEITDVQRMFTSRPPFVLDESTQTTYYPLFRGSGGGTLSNLGLFGSTTPSEYRFEPQGV